MQGEESWQSCRDEVHASVHQQAHKAQKAHALVFGAGDWKRGGGGRWFMHYRFRQASGASLGFGPVRGSPLLTVCCSCAPCQRTHAHVGTVALNENFSGSTL